MQLATRQGLRGRLSPSGGANIGSEAPPPSGGGGGFHLEPVSGLGHGPVTFQTPASHPGPSGGPKIGAAPLPSARHGSRVYSSTFYTTILRNLCGPGQFEEAGLRARAGGGGGGGGKNDDDHGMDRTAQQLASAHDRAKKAVGGGGGGENRSDWPD
jgi:hypothetical protein